MRAALTIAAFAAGALAVPYKREVVTDVDVVYVTNVVTVTAGQEPAPVSQAAHYGHHNWGTTIVQSVTTQAPPPYVAPAPASSPAPAAPEAPAYTPPAPTYQAPAPPAASSPSAPPAAVSSYKDIVLYHHNIHRANHSAPDLQWDDGLAASAQIIADTCVYAHKTDVNGGGYGQNIAAGVEPNNISAIITDLFYNGEEPLYSGNYGLADPDMSLFEKWGHFSQIVWKGTTHVACVTKHCPNGLGNVGSDVSPYFTVCNYKSPGNFGGEYAKNVMRPIGKPSSDWSEGLAPGSY